MRPGEFSTAAFEGNVVRVYQETASHHPDRLALQMDDVSFTHAELAETGRNVAGGLRDLGLRPDDRIAVYLPNCPAFVIAALGALGAGTPFVPLNPQYTPREVAYYLRDSDAKVVITHADLRGRTERALDRITADPMVLTVGGEGYSDDRPFETIPGDPHCEPRRDGDIAMQPYTSGTTGEPKGVLYTHRNLRAQSLMGFERTNLPSARERFLSVLPLSHIAGFVNRTWQPLVRGASVYLQDPREWDPEAAMAAIERERITKFGAVTTMYVDLINHDAFGEYDLSSLEESMQGADSMPAAVQERFEEVAGVELFEAYGLTETGGGTHVGINSTFGPRQGTIGQPLRATDCKIVDEDGREVLPGETGELLVRGPHVMAGYHENSHETENAFTAEGYLRTGDIARYDADNYYEIVDRQDHVVVTGGYNVYPTEVEEVLYEYPDVVDAAVVGVPDDRRGETIKAFVITANGATPTESELKNHCLEALAAYKHPREIAFVEQLPRTNSGKVRKFELSAESD